jgi:hypothetical protein
LLRLAFIHAAANGAIRSSWAEDIKAGEYEVFVSSYKARKLRSSVHHLSVQYELLKQENEDPKGALQYKQKHKKKESKALNL